LQVRGAPAIGIAGAFGVALAVRGMADEAGAAEGMARVRAACERLATSRPTAVNLFWALERMRRAAETCGAATAGGLKRRLVAEAQAIHDEDAARCRAIGENGAGLVPEGAGVLTHCNAGGLATAAYGTALAVLFVAHERGKRFRVYVDETRPLLQGSRLTTWELMRAGIDTTLICDSAAGHLMREGKVQMVITGADRIAANGDTANKIGTYGLAVLAGAHGIPFYVAAPTSTFDLSLPDGSGIPIEEREGREVTHVGGQAVAPAGVRAYNPAFDVTPGRYIRAIITERGVIEQPNPQSVGEFFRSQGC